MLGWGHPRYLIWYGVAFRVSLRWVAGINSGEVVSGSTSEVTPEHGLYHDTLWDVTFNIEAHFCTSRLWDTKGYVGGDAGG